MKKIASLLLLSVTLSLLAQETKIPSGSKSESPESVGKKNAAELYREAYDLYEEGKYELALKKINLALKGDNKDLGFYDLKCYILIKLKRNAEIIETATQAIALNPNDAKFYEIRGNTYYFDFQPEKALVDFRKMISLDQTNDRYYNNYLKLLNEKRLDEEMMNLYPRFVKALPQIKENTGKSFLHDVYFYFALPFERSGNYDKALELLNEAIKINNTASMYYNNRGLIYQDKGDLKAALKDLNKAIELKSDDANYFENRFSIHFQNKDYENARKDLLKVLALGNSEGYIYANLANTYQMQGKSREAAENYDIALKKSPDDVGILSNAAYAYFEMGNSAKSFGYLENALKKDPKEIDVLVGLAVLYDQKNDSVQKDRTLKMITENTSYKPSKNLLKELMKDSYTYTDKFQKAWEKLF